MSRDHQNYLRKHRRRLGLTQSDIAELLDGRSYKLVSHYETSHRTPTLEAALIFELIFDMPLSGLCPDLHTKVELLVLTRIQKRIDHLKEQSDTPNVRHRLAVLEEIRKRIVCR